MRNIFILVTILIITLIFQTCVKKNEFSKLNMKQIWDCNASQNFDSTKLAEKLIGTWKWINFSSEMTGLIEADKDILVSFSSSGTFIVSEKGTIVTQGQWALKIIDSTLYGLDLDTPSIYLYGRIILCDNQVLFNNSYVDGGDYLFERKSII
jgi:hypothetical protein